MEARPLRQTACSVARDKKKMLLWLLKRPLKWQMNFEFLSHVTFLGNLISDEPASYKEIRLKKSL